MSDGLTARQYVRRLLSLALCKVPLVGCLASRAPAQEGGAAPGGDGRVFIVEHSHSDIAWNWNIAGEAQARNRNLAAVFKKMREDPSFKWTIECVLFLQNWLEAEPASEPELLEFFRQGRLDCGATYTQPFEDCLYNELLARQMYVGKRWFEERFPGVQLETVLNQDAPLRGHQTQQVYAKAGVKYLKGSRMNTPGFFRWRSPDGTALLAWFQGGYWGKPRIDQAYIAGQLKAQAAFFARHGVLGLTWGHDYNDPLDLSAVVRDWNQGAAEQGRPTVAYGTFKDVLAEVGKRGHKLDEVRGGVPNWWVYEHWPSHSRALQAQRAAGKYLPLAETFHAVKALLTDDFSGYPAEALKQAWAEASYACHTMVSAPDPAPQAVMCEKYQKAAETGRRQTQAALEWLAQQVAFERTGTPVVVFNGLSWSRSDPVALALPPGLGDHPRVEDGQGKAVPCQVSPGKAVVFVAQDVPPLGFRTYYLSAGQPDAEAADPAIGAKWTQPFESQHYRLTPAAGGLAGIFDKEFNRELLAAKRWLGGEWTTFHTNAMGACEGIDFAPHPEKFADRASAHKPEWTCEESGPVFVRWRLAPVKSQHCTVKTALTAYRRLKRLDWTIQVLGNDEQINVEQRLMFPIHAAAPSVAYEAPFGVVQPGKSEPMVFVNKGRFAPPEPLPSAPREVQNWVYADGDGVGITLGTSVGACAFRDFGPGAEDRPVLAPILLACIGNPQRKAYRQPGDFSFHFSLFSHRPGYAHGSRLGIQSQNPLLPVAAANAEGTRKLPGTCSFFAPQTTGACISTVKKAEDDSAIVLRLYDLDGLAVEALVQSYFPLAEVQATDLLERGGKPLAAQANSFTVPLAAWGIETVKVKTGGRMR